MPIALSVLHLRDGDVAITAEPTGGLRCILSKKNPPGETIYDVQSCAIGGSIPSGAKVAVTWGRAELNIWFLGSLIGSSSCQDRLGPHVLVAIQNREHTASREDFSESSTKATAARRDRLMGWQPIPQRPTGDRAADLVLLRDELLQLTELLAMVESGKLYHLAGLANSLRKLTGKAGFGPLPLIQRVAARDNSPLLVFTLDSPNKDVPHAPDVQLQFHAAPRPTGLMSNPIDLDVLLEFTAIKYGKVSISYRDLILILGNKLGSHADAEIVPAIIILKASRGRVLEMLTENIAHFLICIGKLTEELAARLLADAKA